MTMEMPHPVKESVGHLMNVAAFRIRAPVAERLQAEGVEMCVWPVLVCLWEQDDVSQADIATRSDLAGYMVSRNVDRLETAGLVERRPDPANRRVRRVCLTPRGRALEAEVMPIAIAANALALQRLEVAEGAELLRLLKKMLGR